MFAKALRPRDTEGQRQQCGWSPGLGERGEMQAGSAGLDSTGLCAPAGTLGPVLRVMRPLCRARAGSNVTRVMQAGALAATWQGAWAPGSLWERPQLGAQAAWEARGCREGSRH